MRISNLFCTDALQKIANLKVSIFSRSRLSLFIFIGLLLWIIPSRLITYGDLYFSLSEYEIKTSSVYAGLDMDVILIRNNELLYEELYKTQEIDGNKEVEFNIFRNPVSGDARVFHYMIRYNDISRDDFLYLAQEFDKDIMAFFDVYLDKCQRGYVDVGCVKNSAKINANKLNIQVTRTIIHEPDWKVFIKLLLVTLLVFLCVVVYLWEHRK